MDITTDFGSVILGSNPGRGTLEMKMGGVLLCPEGGYGLVVERVLAKDEAGVRFSLSAQEECTTLGILGIKDKRFFEKSVK